MSPRATYRLQFHKGFTFAEGGRLAPYLARLGVSHVYSSPIATARPGSKHGYDVVDPAAINPELGGAAGFAAMAETLRSSGIGIILDIVPNHMCVADPANAWWMDVLATGSRSAFARYFDIDWLSDDPRVDGKVFLPFLGDRYEKTLRDGAIRLIHDRKLGRFAFAYHHHRFPLCEEDQSLVAGGARAPEAADLSRFQAPAALDDLLARQNFVLGWWRTAGDRINWRRFFDISELAALRIEDPKVFDAAHALPLSLYRDGLIDGVRVDHIDGLADPLAYCRKLRARLMDARLARPRLPSDGPAYIVVEKILAADERLPAGWEVDGTTGYDFLAEISALQHDAHGEPPLKRLWADLSGRPADFDFEEFAGRGEIFNGFKNQLRAAAAAFAHAAGSLASAHDIAAPALERAIAALIRNMRFYRTYATADGSTPLPEAFERALARTRPLLPEMEQGALAFVAAVLAGTSEVDQLLAADAARRLNQLSSAIAAKGVEDTAFYRYGVLLSRNDVGSDPSVFAIPPFVFHSRCERRAQLFPRAMLATATHDHKRGEDTRARLAVLSDIPEEWEKAVRVWLSLSEPIRGGAVAVRDLYQLFQTIVGAWPLSLKPGDRSGLAEFRDRIVAWRIKSLREAKLQTSWTAIDDAFEAAHRTFVETLFDPESSAALLPSLHAFIDRIARAGVANALVQAALKLTVPGVPDIYQGTEFWDFSLVDPDNRRPVDFAAREGIADTTNFETLASNWRDPHIKQALISKLLRHRMRDPALYDEGLYLPIASEGLRKDNIVAFARVEDRRFVLTAVARCCARAVSRETLALDPEWWGDTLLRLGPVARGRGTDLLNGRPVEQLGDTILARDLLCFPVAVLSGDVGRAVRIRPSFVIRAMGIAR